MSARYTSWVLALSLLACSRREGDTKAGASRTPPSAADTVTSEPPELVAFCVANLKRVMSCFDDAAFWDTFSLIHSGAKNQPSDPESKRMFVGVIKDDLMKYSREPNGFAENCRASIRELRWPTPESIRIVSDKREHASCAEFANSWAWMMYGEGAFHLERTKK